MKTICRKSIACSSSSLWRLPIVFEKRVCHFSGRPTLDVIAFYNTVAGLSIFAKADRYQKNIPASTPNIVLRPTHRVSEGVSLKGNHRDTYADTPNR